MKLTKAIEIQEELHDISHDGKDPDWRGAIKLGIEAMKRLEDWRRGRVLNPDLLLPGETE